MERFWDWSSRSDLDGRWSFGCGGWWRPHFGREPLNLESMQPSLTYLSAQGEVLEQITLPDRHLSIRHLAHDGDNTVLCGQQYRGQPDDYPPLVAMHTGTGPLKPLQAEPEQWARLITILPVLRRPMSGFLPPLPPGIAMGSGQKPRANWWN